MDHCSRPARVSAPPSRPPRMTTRQSVLVIANPTAGGGRAKGLLRQLVAVLQAHEVAFEVRATTAPGHASELAADEGAGWPVVAALGGDGTANEVANGLLRLPNPPPLAVLPGGSVNAIARFLGISWDPDAFARTLRAPTVARLDIGWADYRGRTGPERRAFVLLAGTGWNARLIERARSYRRLGNAWTYLLAGLREWWQVSPVAADVQRPDGCERVLLTDALVVNIPIDGPFLQLSPGAKATDGQLEAIVVTAAGRWKLLELLAGLPRGAHVQHRNVSYDQLTCISIHPAHPLPVQLDGELVGQTPFSVRVEPSALPVLLGPGLVRRRPFMAETSPHGCAWQSSPRL